MRKMILAAVTAMLALTSVSAQFKYEWQNPNLPREQRIVLPMIQDFA